jgi:hypothetical protein
MMPMMMMTMTAHLFFCSVIWFSRETIGREAVPGGDMPSACEQLKDRT